MSLQTILESMPNGGAGAVEMGKIKIGGKSKQVRSTAGGGTWRAPEKYDHFVITTMNRDGAGDLIVDAPLMEQLIEKYGDKQDGKLRQIPVRLLSDEIDDIIQSAFVWYGGKTVGARSDGKTVTWFNDPNSGKKYSEPREEEWNPSMLTWKNSRGAALFKCHTVFNCVIAANEARWGGVYKFRTTSVISVRQLHASLLHLTQLTGGILSGMPLMLVVRPMQVAPEGKATTVHVVHVELRGGDLVQLQERALEMAKFRLAFADQVRATTRQYRKLLALPGYESDAEAKDIADEFEPETPSVQSVPEDKHFGLLDDAPAQQPEPEPTPDMDEGRPPITDADVPVFEGEVIEPDVPDADGEPPVDESYASIQRWDDFVAAMQERAQAAKVSPSECDKIIKTIQVRKRWVGKAAANADMTFCRTLVSGADHGIFDWKTGWNKQALETTVA